MIQNYKKIGDYISVVDNRNADGSITNLMGISIEKCYIPSVANVIGTDLHNYKVIRKGQFACSLMQVSRDQRIPLAMYTLDEPAIMSPAYVMFEVNRPEKILPEYMELWFKRAEFDREASFYAVGGVRGSLDWEDFCKMKLPVPSISEQRKIVHDYKVITDRIELLRKMNENLEEQIDMLFKEHVIDNPKYDFNEHIDDNIEYVNGLAMQDFRPQDGEIPLPVIKIRELTQGCCDGSSEYCSPSIDPSRIINTGDLVFSWSGSLRLSFWSSSQAGLNQHLFKVTSSTYPDWFMYLWTKYYLEDFQRIAENKGTTFGHIKRGDLHAKMIKSLDTEGMNRLNEIFCPIQMSVMGYAREIQELQTLKTICLGSIGSPE